MASLVVGCGDGAVHRSAHTATRAARTTVPPAAVTPAPSDPGRDQRAVPTPGPTGRPADPTAVSVIRAWSDALRAGNVRTAAHYFALPSVMINGTDAGGQALLITIETRAQAQAANSTLPCGARLISTDQRGRYVNALFRLTGRPGPGGSDCGGGAGTTARTNFVIRHGQIVEWIRAPNDPGDNGTPRTPPPAPSPSPALAPGPQPAV